MQTLTVIVDKINDSVLPEDLTIYVNKTNIEKMYETGHRTSGKCVCFLLKDGSKYYAKNTQSLSDFSLAKEFDSSGEVYSLYIDYFVNNTGMVKVNDWVDFEDKDIVYVRKSPNGLMTMIVKVSGTINYSIEAVSSVLSRLNQNKGMTFDSFELFSSSQQPEASGIAWNSTRYTWLQGASLNSGLDFMFHDLKVGDIIESVNYDFYQNGVAAINSDVILYKQKRFGSDSTVSNNKIKSSGDAYFVNGGDGEYGPSLHSGSLSVGIKVESGFKYFVRLRSTTPGSSSVEINKVTLTIKRAC